MFWRPLPPAGGTACGALAGAVEGVVVVAGVVVVVASVVVVMGAVVVVVVATVVVVVGAVVVVVATVVVVVSWHGGGSVTVWLRTVSGKLAVG